VIRAWVPKGVLEGTTPEPAKWPRRWKPFRKGVRANISLLRIAEARANSAVCANRYIREAREPPAPVFSIGPKRTHEAEAIIAGIHRLCDRLATRSRRNWRTGLETQKNPASPSILSGVLMLAGWADWRWRVEGALQGLDDSADIAATDRQKGSRPVRVAADKDNRSRNSVAAELVPGHIF
jgi:hypothetical protein